MAGPSTTLPSVPADPPRHRPYEDAQGLVTGTLFAALGVLLFQQAGLLPGGTVGLAHFSTATSIRVPAYETSSGRAETVDARTNFSHTGRTVGGVGGVLIPLARLGLDLGSATLDVGVRYQRNPHALFVRPGDVRLNATTSPDISTSEGEANVLSYRLGVAARFD